MKVTIELTPEEVQGIKAYLRDVDGTERPTKADVKNFIEGIVSGTIRAPQEAVSDYIKQATK